MGIANHTFSAFSFIGFVLVCVPFPWHAQAWNTGTCLYMGWTGLMCLVFFINSIVWDANVINWAPVWCDITAKLVVGISVAIPATSLCINRRLYHIASVRTVTRSAAEKRRAILMDVCIGVGIPVLIMILQYIVQGHRFDIYEDIGCYPFTYLTWPAFLIVLTPPLALGVASAVYCVLSIMCFRKRQAEFNEILSSNSNLTSHRYFRLMALASIEALCNIPFNITIIVLNAVNGKVQPWVSWEDTHFGFSRVDEIPAVLWKANTQIQISLELTRWLVVVCAFVFFGFFGFADEAKKHYKLALNVAAKRVGISVSNSPTKVGSGFSGSNGRLKLKRGETLNPSASAVAGSMPVYISKEVIEKRDSLDSISDMMSFSELESQPNSLNSTLKKQDSSETICTDEPNEKLENDLEESKETLPVQNEPKSPVTPMSASTASIYSTNTNPVELAPPPSTRRSPAMFPTSVTPSGSFLDLSETDLEVPHTRDATSADNRV
ncbi:pheromone A receptor-domain-containing protein [Crucibulum laeve]|uniref:Pheromone A receptor-domain-containing protein n=1 Tax=Crucibulum laeve TaxID=68775 RepID=A0A5C3MGM7_9AGAR|nr:pheromone A receptor-domain-containing protein [Crucibulum laeve]